MKKLAFFFIILISLTIIAGCNSTRKKVTHFSSQKGESVIENAEEDDAKTTITTLNNGEKAELEPIEIPASNEEGVELSVTSMEKNSIESDKGYHLIQGTTPKNTTKIVVNEYPLNKYEAGETEWSYIAAVSLGTLEKGENHYTIRAIDAEGNEIASENFSILYNGIDSGALVPAGSNLNLVFILTVIGIFGFYSFRKRFQS